MSLHLYIKFPIKQYHSVNCKNLLNGLTLPAPLSRRYVQQSLHNPQASLAASGMQPCRAITSATLELKTLPLHPGCG